MPNGSDGFRLRQPTRQEKTELALTGIIDFTMAMYALLCEKGYISPDEMAKMEPLTKEARRRLGGDFSLQEGINAIRAAYRIEISRREPK